MWDGLYTPHRNEGNPMHNDDCIYTPDVVLMEPKELREQVIEELKRGIQGYECK